MKNKSADILARANQAPGKAFYHLVPRYSSGSPAMVDLGEAVRVADHEQEAYFNCLTGVFGNDLQVMAKSKGLSGIAYARWEKGNKVYRLDLLTGIESIEPPRLTSKECDRVRDLRNERKHLSLTPLKTAELMALESRLEIHRDTVN